MPKKTKKEKIIAEYRRRIASTINTHTTTTAPTPLSANPVANTFHFAPVQSHNLRLTPDSSTELKTIKADLRKTVFLAAIAILIELILSWQLKLRV